MSFQYINTAFAPNYMNYRPYPNQVSYNPYTQNPMAQYSPYPAAFYNAVDKSAIYPYNNPLYQPVVAKPYTKLGVFSSPTGELVHLFKMASGQHVAIMPRKDEATIVKTFVNTGSIVENDRLSGGQHVKEHGHFLSSKTLERNDVFKLTSLMGASTNASTDYAEVKYYITAPYMDEENLKKTIEIQGDMLSNPKFDEAELKSEIEPVCSEISMINDDPITSAFDKVIRNLFQIQSNSENLVAGSIDTVRNLTSADMRYLHDRYYTPENIMTVVVGDVDVDKTMELVSNNFKFKSNNLPNNERQLTPIQKAVREDVRSSKTNSTSAIVAFAGPKPTDSKDFIIYKMIDYYLSACSTSEFKNTLEKMSASYDSTTQKVGIDKNDPYALISMMDLNPNDEGKALDAFWDAIQKLQTQPLSDDEMQTLRNVIEKLLVINMCGSENICEILGGCMLDNSLDLFVNYREIAKTITKQDIMNFARKYYDLNKASIVVVHPTTVSEKDIEQNYKNSKYSPANFMKLQNNSAGLDKINPINTMSANQQPVFRGRSAKSVSFAGNSRKISTEGIFEDILENNTHLALNGSKSDLCVFNWSVNTPPVKPKNPNIPAVLMYIFEKGTDYKSQMELEQYKELNGIDASVYTNGRSIEISANCLSDKTEETLKLMSELMHHPKFTQSDFDEAVKYTKDILKASQKDASSNLLDKLYPGYFPTESAMLKSIDELTLDDIKEFYQELLKNASSAFVATVSNDKYNETLEAIKTSQKEGGITFKTLTPKLYPMFQAQDETSVIYDTDDLNQAQIYKSYKFPMSGNIEDEVKFELLNTILGGSPSARLFSDLREKENLAYSVSSTVQSFENTGILTLKIQTTTDNPQAGIVSYDNVQKSLEGFQKHTDLLCGEYVSDEELEAAKTRLKQNITGQFQNPVSQTALLAMNVLEPYGIKRIDEYYKAIDSITKEDIKQAANFVFSHKPTISVLASEDTIKSQLPYLESLGSTQKAT